MNKTRRSLTALVLCAATLLTATAFTGCVTSPTGQRLPDVAAMSSIAKSATFIGCSVYLNGIPPNVPGHQAERPKFVLARNSLQTLIAAGNFSPQQLTAALSALPIKQLQGPNGALIVGEAVILWDTYGRQLADLDKAQVFPVYILPVATAILEGLDMALGPTL